MLALMLAALLAVAGMWMGPSTAVSAQTNFPDPNANCPVAECGKVSPLIPMQSTEAVHMGLVWKRDSQRPKILFHSRFPEYAGIDMADPALTDLAIARGALTTAGNQFNSSLRDVLHGFDPFLGLGTNRYADDSFQRLTYGGYLMRQGLSQSVPTRIVANRTMERQLLFDINHPSAFANTGKFHTALLDEQDFAMNRAAFTENGHSKGMFYNTYCNARVTLSDGRVYVFGGHDMQSNNGIYKVNIFDPNTETWVPRSEPCTRSNWTRDPFGQQLFAADPLAPHYNECDPRDQQSTQPSDPSDQKYSRWYPSAIPLPNDWVLVVGGFDQDNTIPPDPNRVAKGKANQSQSDTAFTATRVNIVVPEVYDPKSDRNIALENARMAFPLYPQLEVVQTGRGRNDWSVCTLNGEIDYGPELIPGGARFGVGGGTPPFTKGTMWCLDVIGAMKDPKRDVPAKNHWTLVDTSSEVRPYCCPTASLVELDDRGRTKSHRWFQISGQDPTVIRPAPSKWSSLPTRCHATASSGASCSRSRQRKRFCCPTEKSSSVRVSIVRTTAPLTAGRATTSRKKVCTSRCSIPTPAAFASSRERQCRAACTARPRCCQMARCFCRREPRSAGAAGRSVVPDDELVRGRVAAWRSRPWRAGGTSVFAAVSLQPGRQPCERGR